MPVLIFLCDQSYASHGRDFLLGATILNFNGSWRERDDPENRACEISLARLSPRLLRRRESKRHLFVVGSLDKQMQNEKELIRLASAKGKGAIVYFFGFL